MTHPTVMPDLIGHLCRRSFASAQDDIGTFCHPERSEGSVNLAFEEKFSEICEDSFRMSIL